MENPIQILLDQEICDPQVLALLEAHQAHCEAETPIESCHRLDVDKLRVPSISFFVARDGDEILGVGALADIGAECGEVKSMHVSANARGRGVGQLILDAVIAKAKALGKKKICLETGAQDNFKPAVAFYEQAGFTECPPFGNYQEDVNSRFMQLSL